MDPNSCPTARKQRSLLRDLHVFPTDHVRLEFLMDFQGWLIASQKPEPYIISSTFLPKRTLQHFTLTVPSERQNSVAIFHHIVGFELLFSCLSLRQVRLLFSPSEDLSFMRDQARDVLERICRSSPPRRTAASLVSKHLSSGFCPAVVHIFPFMFASSTQNIGASTPGFTTLVSNSSSPAIDFVVISHSASVFVVSILRSLVVATSCGRRTDSVDLPSAFVVSLSSVIPLVSAQKSQRSTQFCLEFRAGHFVSVFNVVVPSSLNVSSTRSTTSAFSQNAASGSLAIPFIQARIHLANGVSCYRFFCSALRWEFRVLDLPV